MEQQDVIQMIFQNIGGKENIISAENCMTRLRFNLKDESLVNYDALKNIEGVLGVVRSPLQIIVGPGKSKKMMSLIQQQLPQVQTNLNEKEENPVSSKPNQSMPKENKFKQFFQKIANIFVPLIPAIIAAGLFNGISGLLTTLQSSGTISKGSAITLIILFLSLMGNAFFSYFQIYVGINSAKVFGATPALGGMIGAITIMPNIDNIAKLIGLYNEQIPKNSILQVQRGGIIAVILGVFILAQIEKFVRKHIPDVLDLIVTPTITIILTALLLVFVIMPLTGWFSDGLMLILNFLINSSNPVISIFTGYILAALFLPLVLVGMHQALIPIYVIQLDQLGVITLFPVLAMAGAGQIGTSIAIYIKARRLKKHQLTKTIAGALPAGILGVGEPLLYGVTFPMGKPFITGGLGAGFGGAWIMLMHVTSQSYGTSGFPGVLLMTPNCMLNYIIGLFIGMIGGFVLGYLFIRDKEVENFN